MVVGSFTEIVCFSSAADVPTEIADLVIIFAVACDVTLYNPGSSFCVERFVFLRDRIRRFHVGWRG